MADPEFAEKTGASAGKPMEKAYVLLFLQICSCPVPGFVSLVHGIVSWVLGFVFWVLGIVFWVLGFVFWVSGFVFWVSGCSHNFLIYTRERALAG